MADYTNVLTTINNKILSQTTNVTISHNPGLIEVDTFGGMGMADGTAKMEVRLDMAVAAIAPEFEPSIELRRGMKVPFGAVAFGKQIQQQMWIQNFEFTRGVNDAPRLSVSLIGPYKEWED